MRIDTINCLVLLSFVMVPGTACSSDLDNTGRSCTSADECYFGIDHADIQGDVTCLDRVKDGYCTHTCETDADCCAVEGECDVGLPQVCGPFESTGMKFCFLSCENIGDVDETEYCQNNAHVAFICRSTGGGSENRKVCVPPGD